MRVGYAVGAAALAAVGLAGCAGVPVVMSAASLYVDSILVLRTDKTSGDHLLSAVMDRDCAVTHLFTEGSFCKDAPPTPLLASLMREVQASPTTPPTSTAVAPVTPLPEPVEVAALTVGATLDDGTPAVGAARLPDHKPPPVAAVSVDITAPVPATGTIRQAALHSGRGQFLVVVGSFTKRAQAEEQRARLARTDAEILPATVRGRTYHRVVLPPVERSDALRLVAQARTDGVKDAWLLPWSGRVTVETAVAALPMVGFLYRM